MLPEENVKELLKHLGEDPTREGLKETPSRVIRSYETLFSGYKKDPKDILTVFDGEDYDQMIIVKDIEFYSTCEHHMLPFFGKIHIGYIPSDKIIGLSKLPRLVEIYSRRLQNQERVTSQIAQALDDLLKPKGVGVIAEAQHFCMMARGVQKQNSTTVTSSMLGEFRENATTRKELLSLLHRTT
mgnify:CR=1 FL=1